MKPKKRTYANLYTAAVICLLALAVGAAVDFRVSRKQAAETDAQATDFTRVSVVWATEAAPQTEAADLTVADVPDQRQTAAAATVPRNKPYSGDFLLPMGSDVAKGFSAGEPVYSETMGDWRAHNGVDFSGSAGNDVFAAADGAVQRVYDDSFWGTVMEIDHGNGLVLRYCGLQSGSCLREGSEVTKGARIAALGHIPLELADGDHLHLEAEIDGEAVDPLRAMNKAGLLEA